MANSRRMVGIEGEHTVALWLQAQGFSILASNFTVRQGEVDIIASNRDLVVFVEVKARRTRHFPLSELITRAKQRKIILAAQHYLLREKLSDKIFRFDVALVTGENLDAVEYIPNAFTHEAD